jgi:hypothetical protein
MKKTESKKSRDTVPLMCLLIASCNVMRLCIKSCIQLTVDC